MSPRPESSPSRKSMPRTPRGGCKKDYASPTKKQRPPKAIPSTPDLVNQLSELSFRSPVRRSPRFAAPQSPILNPLGYDDDSDKENYRDENLVDCKSKKTPTKTPTKSTPKPSAKKRLFGDHNPRVLHKTPEKPRIAGGHVLRTTPRVNYVSPTAAMEYADDHDFVPPKSQAKAGTAKRRIAPDLSFTNDDDPTSSSSSSTSSDDSDSDDSDFVQRPKRTPKKSVAPGPKVTPIVLLRQRPETGDVTINAKAITTAEYKLLKKDAYELAQRRKRREQHPLMRYFSNVHTSAEPEIINRDAECEQIASFIKSAVGNNALVQLSRSMYISGVPGTGKTATVTKVIRGLLNGSHVKQKNGRKSMKPAKKLDFTYVYVNALELVKPQDVFTHIYGAVNEKATKAKRITAPKTARRHLDTIFRTADRCRRPVVLVIDELDMLCNKSQDVVYDIFEWATTEEAKLVVIAIANTLDLPERVLKQRVSSRMGYNRLTFQAYSYEQIDQMLQHRLQEGKKLVDPNATLFIARKVSSVSGDFRKALEIFRRSIEIAVDADDRRVTIKHAQAAIKEGLDSAQSRFTKSLSRHQNLLLRAVINELRDTGLPETDFHFVYDKYSKNCDLSCIEPLGTSTALKLAKVLMQMGYVDFKGTVGSIWCKVTLRTSLEETEDMLKSALMTLN
uniref:Origin recognition complex subunit 1 n=1 Tax=Panagrellus redivivus TaxID=6233 RepID=A0A7E4VW56_PANRE